MGIIIVDYMLNDKMMPENLKPVIALTTMFFVTMSVTAHLKNSFATKDAKKCHYCAGRIVPDSYVCKLCEKHQ